MVFLWQAVHGVPNLERGLHCISYGILWREGFGCTYILVAYVVLTKSWTWLLLFMGGKRWITR